MFSVAIETMIEEIRNLVMKTALIRPQAIPTAPAIAKMANQPSPWLMARVSATYCATEAVAVNEMSIPPATSTTSRPAARMPMKAFEVSRSNRFCSVRKLSVASDRSADSATTTASSQNSWLRRKRCRAGARNGRSAVKLIGVHAGIYALTAARSSSSVEAWGKHSPTRAPRRMIRTRWA